MALVNMVFQCRELCLSGISEMKERKNGTEVTSDRVKAEKKLSSKKEEDGQEVKRNIL